MLLSEKNKKVQYYLVNALFQRIELLFNAVTQGACNPPRNLSKKKKLTRPVKLYLNQKE